MTCEQPGCEKETHARGLCAKHYKATLTAGTQRRAWIRQDGVCSAEGCDKRPRARGLCTTHVSRQYRHGIPECNPGRGRKGYGVPVSPPTPEGLIVPLSRRRPCSNCGETVLVVPGLSSGNMVLDAHPCADGNVVISPKALGRAENGLGFLPRLAAIMLAPYVLAELNPETARYRLHVETCTNMPKPKGRQRGEYMQDVRGWGRAS